jgi:hypothetical protein
MDPTPHPRDMAHRIVPAAPTRITVSGGPKVESHLSQPDAEPVIPRSRGGLLLALVALVIVAFGVVTALVLGIPA